jgi:hypothetical protein
MSLKVDPNRVGKVESGILVQASTDYEMGRYDCMDLDAQSFFEWMRSRGGENEWAENILLTIAGYREKVSDLEKHEPPVAPADGIGYKLGGDHEMVNEDGERIDSPTDPLITGR